MSAPEPTNCERIEAFNAFVNQAMAALAHEQPAERQQSVGAGSKGDVIERFDAFVRQAEPIVCDQIKTTLRSHRGRLDKICRWLVPASCDVLSAAGLNGDEVRYTRLIAWLLWPEGRPDLALRLQRAWMEALGLGGTASDLREAIKPRTEFSTDDGRADMVLNFESPDFILIVEAKIGTDEHTTPDEKWQTEAYPTSVRRRLGLPADHPGVMVFLTPDGRGAQSQDTVSATYEALIAAVADAVSPEEFSHEMRWSYAAVLTHLLTHATPGGSVGVEALRQYSTRQEKDVTDGQILRDLSFLGPLCRTLRAREQI